MARLLVIFALVFWGCGKPDSFPRDTPGGVFDPSAFGPREAPGSGPQPAPIVVDYGPRGDGTGLWNVGQVFVRFNQPMVPFGGAAEQSSTALALTSDGKPVAGHAYWQTPDRLVFESADALTPARTFEASFAGADEVAPTRWSFETGRPTVELVEPVDRGTLVDRDAPIYLRTSLETPIASVAKQLTLRADGRDMNPRVRAATEVEEEQLYAGGGGTLVVVEHDRFAVAAKVEVQVEAGWRGTPGPLPATERLAAGFQVHPLLDVTHTTCDGADSCGIRPIELEFSTLVARDQLRHIRVSPRPPEMKVLEDWGDPFSSARIEGRFVPGQTYRVSADAAMTDVFGQRLGTTKTFEVSFDMPPEELYLTTAHGNVLDDDRAHVGVSTRHVRKLRVRLAKVPIDRYRELYFAEKWRTDRLPSIDELGEVVETEIATDMSGPSEWASTPIDIAKLAGTHRGPVAVEVIAVEVTRGYEDGIASLVDTGAFVLGSLAPIAFTSSSKSVLRVEDLAHDRIAEGVDVMLHSATAARALGSTDANGLLEFESRGATKTDDLLIVRDRTSGEVGIAPLIQAASTAAAPWLRRGETVSGELLAERGVYRPGDDVFVAGWSVVQTPHTPFGQRTLDAGVKATLELVDRDGVVIATDHVATSDGRFWSKLRIPTSSGLGHVTVRASYDLDGVTASDRTSTTVRVEEFRTPDFEVSGKAAKTSVVGDEELVVDIHSRYLSGTRAGIRSSRARQTCWDDTPPHVDGWQLGVNQRYHGGRIGRTPTLQNAGLGDGRVVLPSLAADDGRTLRCSLTVTVQNASYQEEGVSVPFDVHPSDKYIGLPELPDVVRPGNVVDIAPRLFDPSGQPLDAGRETVDFTLTQQISTPVYSSRGRESWVSHWEETEQVIKRCAVEIRNPRCRTPRLAAGEYRLEGQSRTDPRRRFRTEFSVRKVEEQSPVVTIEAPATLLTPGKMTAVTVKTEATHGVLVVDRHGLVDAIPFQTRRGSASISLQTDGSWAPSMRVAAWVVNRETDIPSLETASSVLRFDASGRDLDVRVAAPEFASVREEVTVQIEAESNGEAIDGRAVVWAVDDAILALTNYAVPNLAEAFYPPFVRDVAVIDSLSATLPRFVPEKYDPYTSILRGFGSGSGFGAGGGGLGGAGESPRLDFRATPLYLGDVVVEDGKAVVTFRLPDNMTRFRVIAVVSSNHPDAEAPVRFGTSSDTISVGAPLVVRPALPRFIRPGDTAQLAAVIQNTSGKAGSLRVQFAIDGEAIDWVTGVTPSAELPMAVDQELRVAFDARALKAGSVAVTMRSSMKPDDGSPAFQDSVQVPLVSDSEPTLTETVATYGTIDARSRGLVIKPPDGAHPDIGGVTVTLTSTILGGLQDATRQLVTYPYGCAEQTASRMLPLVGLAGLAGFVEAAEIPNGQTVAAFVNAGVDKLLAMQQSDGGFGYWTSSGMSHPYVSAYVTWILHLAARAGYDVPKPSFTRALDYLETVVAKPDETLPDSVIYYADIRRAIAVHVLAEAGRRPTAAIDRLLEQPHLPVFSRAFVVAAVASINASDPRLPELTRLLLNTVTETPGSASVVETPRYDLGPVFHSDLRSSAIVALALTRADPGHPVITKLARGLMEKRYRGAWRNTQENAYALVALGDYARTFEAVEPNFELDVSIENAVLVSDQWRGRSSKARVGRLRMNELVSLTSKSSNDTLPLQFQKRGEGTAYYRLAMTYAPSAAELPPIARGIEVERTVRREAAAASAHPEQIQAGEVIALDVEIQTRSLLRYVAVNVPVPAGFEPINISLGSAKTLPLGGAWGWWMSHHELHDDRVLLFADTLHPGPHRHTIYLRASTPGSYVFPPARAEAMYTPEVFGRTEGTRVDVR